MTGKDCDSSLSTIDMFNVDLNKRFSQSFSNLSDTLNEQKESMEKPEAEKSPRSKDLHKIRSRSRNTLRNIQTLVSKSSQNNEPFINTLPNASLDSSNFIVNSAMSKIPTKITAKRDIIDFCHKKPIHR